MHTIQRSEQRGKSELSWLHSRFSFNFANYYNPNRTGFGKLLVLNDDIIEPGTGFGEHSHDNMEIISIATEGELSHKDSTGAEEVIKPGELQVMSAGSGMTHSEYNHSKTKPAKFFQIWIESNKPEMKPRHKKKVFKLQKNKLQLVISPKDIYQDASIYLGKFDKGLKSKQTKEFSYL